MELAPGLPFLRAGGRTLSLPHCQADASISAATAHGKQEALQLHTVLEGAGTAAAAGNHAAVVRTLAPVLLCCTDKEQQMHELDQAQWLRGMQMLLAAAEATRSWGLALRCHLRLMNALLPVASSTLAPLVHGQEDAAAGVAASAAAAALHACAEQLVGQPPAVAALDATAAFLQKHRAALEVAVAPANSSVAAQRDTAAGPQALALHPMERAMYEAVQQQLALVLASCGAALGALGSAVESQLNIKVGGLLAAGPLAVAARGACAWQCRRSAHAAWPDLPPSLPPQTHPQVNAQRAAMCDAAAALLHLDSLAAASRQSSGGSGGPGGGKDATTVLLGVERAQDVAWQLCNALGNVQALMERRGRFVQVR